MTSPLTKEQLEVELGRAYRCIQGMHNALRNGAEFAEFYHSPTLGAAKRYVYLSEMDGSQFFEGKPITELHEALSLGFT